MYSWRNLLCIGLAALIPALAGASPAARVPLGALLNADGELQLPAGFAGEIDSTGYQVLPGGGLSPRFARVDAAKKYFGVPRGCNGPVLAMARAPDGRIYLGGGFEACGDAAASRVAVYDPRSGRFASLGSGVDAEILALSIHGNQLYAAGRFSRAGGVAAPRLARWDGASWHPSPMSSGSELAAIEADAGGVFVSEVGSQPGSVAYWNIETNVVTALPAAPVPANLSAGPMALSAHGLYVAFSGNQAPTHIVLWDGQGWTVAAGTLSGSLTTLASNGPDLYVGGNFAVAGIAGSHDVARWNGAAWTILTDPTGVLRGSVAELAVSGHDVYASGSIDSVSSFVARFIDGGWSNIGRTVEGAASMLVADGALYLGGQIQGVGSVPLDHVGRWNGSAWSPLALGLSDSGVAIRAMAVAASGVYVGGRFNVIHGVPANHVARWNGSSWSPLGAGLGGVDADVAALAVVGDELYAGGSFTEAGGAPANHVARWNGSAWLLLGSGASNGVNGPVADIVARSATEIYVAGSFDQARDLPVRALARWNGSAWSALGSGFPQQPNLAVNALAIDGASLYAGGVFSRVGGIDAAGIARWEGGDWSSLGGIVRSGSFSGIRDIAAVDGKLYVVGDFSCTVGDQFLIDNARWDGQRWSAIGSGNVSDIGTLITNVAASGSEVYVSGPRLPGAQSPLGASAAQRRFARWNGNLWQPLFDPNPAYPSTPIAPIVLNQGAVSLAGLDLRASGQPQLVSHAANTALDIETNGQARLSRDGSRVAFVSTPRGSNLKAVYVRDRTTGGLTRVSDIAQALDGWVKAFDSPAISADGLSVAMVGSVTTEIYVVRNGRAQFATIGSGFNSIPDFGYRKGHPMLSSDGRRLVFDTNGPPFGSPFSLRSQAIDLKDMETGVIEWVSRPADGDFRTLGDSREPWASDDGRWVAFSSVASNITTTPGNSQFQIVLSHLVGSAREAIYVSRNLRTGELGNAESSQVRLTPDGRRGVFVSAASNLVDGDSNNASDVFYFETDGAAIVRLERVSVGNQGNQANGGSEQPSISDDASYVAFSTLASNLVLFDRNGVRDVVIKNLSTGEVLRQTASADGKEPDQADAGAQISGDAGSLVYTSAASSVVPNDGAGTADVYWAPIREQIAATPGAGIDQPGFAGFALPIPNPAFANCPAGYFTVTIEDGPGVGLSPGLFGVALQLDPGGSQRLEGGLNFGGLIDRAQPAFAGFNVQNPANEPQRLDIQLIGYPATSTGGTLPVRIKVIRQPAAGVDEVVFERSATLSTAQAVVDSIVIQPGYHVVTVVPEGFSADADGGAAEGQIFFQLGTRFVDRPGGGFLYGVVVGGYHATHPFDDVSGFAAICLGTSHSATARTFAAPEYGSRGARDLRLRLQDWQRREILVRPE